MSDLAWVYVIGVLCTFCAIMAMAHGNWKDRRNAARVAFLIPVWPVVWVFGAVVGVRALWRAADWKDER